MTESSEQPGRTAAKPTCYRIRVSGTLDPSWSDRVGGMLVTVSGRFGEESTTVLEGELQDQSALLGVINTLYELHLPLLTVESQSERHTNGSPV